MWLDSHARVTATEFNFDRDAAPALAADPRHSDVFVAVGFIPTTAACSTTPGARARALETLGNGNSRLGRERQRTSASTSPRCCAVVPLQLLAYHVAMLEGTDVDQPQSGEERHRRVARLA